MRYLVVAQPIEQYKQKEKYCMPLGIAYVNGALRAAGLEVDGINMMFVEGDPFEALYQKIIDGKFDVVFCGGLSAEYPMLKRVYDIAKAANPEIITIGGGGGFSASPILFSELTGVDFAVIGEGEITDVALAMALEQGTDIREIEGIVYKDPEGYHQTKKREPIYDLDGIPFPSYEGLAIEEYLSHQRVDGWYNYFTYYSDEPRMMPMLMSRSCPYMCSFCFHPIGRGYRARGLDNFFEELDMWIEKYHINGIALVDECFSMDPDTVIEFSHRIKPYHIAWACQMRAEIYNYEMMKAMKESGCIGACFGIESMSQAVLDNMQKHLKQETIEKALQVSYECGVGASGNLIFGAETECFDTVWESIQWNRKHMENYKHQPINAFTYIQTYPGSRYYNHAVKNGLISSEAEFIKNGKWILNITQMTDREYGIVGEAARLLQHETRDQGTLLCLDEQADGRLAVTITCPHCKSTHTYRNLSRRHLKEHRIRNLGCRTCNGMADYLIDSEYFPYDHYCTVDWMLGKYKNTDKEIINKNMVLAMKELLRKETIKIGVLGAGYIADEFFRAMDTDGSSGIIVEWVLPRKNVNKLSASVVQIDDPGKGAKVDAMINAELVHPEWALKQTLPDIPMMDLEEIVRIAGEKSGDTDTRYALLGKGDGE